MGKYLRLQIKRFFRYLPGILLVMLVLLGGLLAAFSMLVRQDAAKEENQKYQIVLCGAVEDNFLQMGLAALEAFDSTRFAVEIIQMEEPEAAAALDRGEIAAYVVVPEGFVENAMHGDIMQLRMVSTVGASGMVSLFKEEIARLVSLLLLEAQRGVFGMIDSFEDCGVRYRQDLVDALCIEYVQFVFTRSDTYTLQQLGISRELGLADYLLCGFCVLFLLLASLPFAPLLIRRDPALGQMLAAGGRSALGQSLCDFAAFGLAFLSALGVCFTLLGAVPGISLGEFSSAAVSGRGIVYGITTAVMAAAFSFLLLSLAADLLSGVLLQFFVTVCVCFVSGCMYPVFFFPESVQKLALWLPTGAARDLLGACITGKAEPRSLILVLGYSLLFLVLGCTVKVRAIRSSER